MRRLTLTTIAVVTLGSLHLTSPAVAQTNGLIGAKHTITVGTAHGRAGYCTAPGCGTTYVFGSIFPATTPESLTVISFVDLPGIRETEGYNRTELAISGFTSDPGKNWQAQASCGAVTYVGAAATVYHFAGGLARWFWPARNGAQPAFLGREFD